MLPTVEKSSTSLKLKSYTSRVSTFVCTEIEVCSHKNLYAGAHSIIIYDSQEVEITQMSTS